MRSQGPLTDSHAKVTRATHDFDHVCHDVQTKNVRDPPQCGNIPITHENIRFLGPPYKSHAKVTQKTRVGSESCQEVAYGYWCSRVLRDATYQCECAVAGLTEARHHRTVRLSSSRPGHARGRMFLSNFAIFRVLYLKFAQLCAGDHGWSLQYGGPSAPDSGNFDREKSGTFLNLKLLMQKNHRNCLCFEGTVSVGVTIFFFQIALYLTVIHPELETNTSQALIQKITLIRDVLLYGTLFWVNYSLKICPFETTAKWVWPIV